MKLATLNDLKKKGEDDDKKKTDTELFVGGLDNRGGGSGLNVLPNDAAAGSRRGSSDIFDRIMQRAIDGSTSREADDSPTGSDPAGPNRKITLWRNGFSVDDGPLRDPSIPESLQFMERLDRGQIPREFLTGDPSDQLLELRVENRRNEDYTPPPKPAYVAFSHGASLGSSVTDSSVITTEMLAENPAPVIDESKPTTTLQVRLLDGSKIKIKLNHTSTALHLAAAVGSGSLATSPSGFALSGGYPPKDISGSDLSKSLQELSLLGAAIIVKKAT